VNRSDDLHQLDARAADAARDLQALAAARPVPAAPTAEGLAFADAPAPRTVRPPRLLAAAAAIVVLAALAAGLWAIAGPDDDEPASQVGVDSVRPYAVTDLPDGFEVVGASAARPTGGGDGSLAVYGPADDDPRIGIVLVDDPTLNDLAGDDTPTFRAGDIESLDLSSLGFAPTMISIDAGAGRRSIVAIGREMGREELAGFAAAALERAASNPGSPAELTATELPSGWRNLASLPDGLANAVSTFGLRGGGTSSHTIAYASPEEDDRAGSVLTVDARLGDRAVQHSTRLFGESEVLDLDGREAVVTGHADEEVGASFLTVTLRASPTEVVRVTGWGLSRDEVLAAATSVEPITEEALTELVRRSRLGGGASDGAAVAEGSLPDGTGWSVSLQDGVTLMLRVDVEPSGDGSSEGSSSSWGPDALVRGTTVTEVGGRRFVALLTDPTVARIELRAEDEPPIDLDVERVPAEAELEDGLGYVVFEATSRELAIAVLDSTGRELAVLPFDDTGFGPETDEVLTEAPTPTTTLPGD
jgi:hypothetical protein